MNAFDVGDAVYLPAREFPDDFYAAYQNYFWSGRIVGLSRDGLYVVHTDGCAIEYVYDAQPLLNWEREYDEVRAAASLADAPPPRSRRPPSHTPSSQSVAQQSAGLGLATLLAWRNGMGVPASDDAPLVPEPMPMGDQDLDAQMAQLRAAVSHLEAQKIADDTRYDELRGKVVVIERIRVADALRYRQDMEKRDAAERLQLECAAAAHKHAADAMASTSSALRHAHGHCTSCHANSLGITLCDDPICASHCIV